MHNLLTGFLERQSQQNSTADQPRQQALASPISTTDEALSVFNLLAGSEPTRTRPAPVNSPNESLRFGVNCLRGSHGLVDIQDPTDADNLMDSSLSSLLAGPSPDISNTESGGHSIFDSNHQSGPHNPGFSGNTSSSNNTNTSPSESLHTVSRPKTLTESLTPASLSSSTNGLCPRTAENLDAGSGWLSALHIAAQKGHHRVMRVLLQHDIDCNEADSDGLTPLIHATIGGHEDVVTLLLMHGARIGKVDCQGRSVLHFAVIHRREALLRTLLDYCVGNQGLVDDYDNGGRTPLHTAVDAGFEAGVQALLQSGASIHYRTRKRVTP